jgi:Tol biopolymer transport system component
LLSDEHQVYLMDEHGQYVRSLVKAKADAIFCDSTRKVAYYAAGEAGDEKNRAIWSVPLAGGTPQKLMPLSHVASMVYSADGTRAAYIVREGDKATATIIDLDRRSVAREIPLADVAPGTLPHFTPDGKVLAFVEQQPQGFALAAQPLDGTPARLITTWFKSPILDFGWSPGGKTLAILWDRSTSDAAVIEDTSKESR